MRIRTIGSHSTTALAIVVLAAGCASTWPAAAERSERQQRTDARYAEYEAYAGAQVSQLRLLGSITSWTALGDDALVVNTTPSKAFLLDLSGPCNELRSAIAIGLTSRNGIVSAKFDKVLPRTSSPIQMPCHIDRIRPVDQKALRAARRGEGAADEAPPAQPSGT